MSQPASNSVGLIGLIGLGLVGTALASRLRAGGFTCIGYDLSPQALERFAAAGYSVAATPAQVAACASTVLLAVMDTCGVEAVVDGDVHAQGKGGLLAGWFDPNGPQRDLTQRAIIDCSTGDPQRLEQLAARLAAQHIDFIEAPLSGSSQQIANGEATLLLGGELPAIGRAAPVLNALSARRFHAGAAGMGARAKLATNLVLGLNRAALAEGLVFAERLGIAPAAFLEMVKNSPARSDAAFAKGDKMVQGDFTPQSRIRQHLKDVELMLAAASKSGQQLPLTQTHAALLRGAVEAGDGELDNAAVIRQIRRSADCPNA